MTRLSTVAPHLQTLESAVLWALAVSRSYADVTTWEALAQANRSLADGDSVPATEALFDFLSAMERNENYRPTLDAFVTLWGSINNGFTDEWRSARAAIGL